MLKSMTGNPPSIQLWVATLLFSANVLHAKPQPEIAAGTEGDDIYLHGERFQMDGTVTRVIEAIGDAGMMADIIRLRKFSKCK